MQNERKTCQTIGNFYRVQKRLREDEDKSQRNELRRMLFAKEPTQTTSESCGTSSNDQNVTSNSQISTQSNEIGNIDQSPTANNQISNQSNDPRDENAIATTEDSNQSNGDAHTEIQTFGLQNIDVLDPSTWPKIISQKIREYIVDSVNTLPVLSADYSFPKSAA